MPVIFSLISATNLLPKDGLHWLNRITATAVFVVLVQLVLNFDVNSPYRDEYLYLDALSVWMLLIIGHLVSGLCLDQ